MQASGTCAGSGRGLGRAVDVVPLELGPSADEHQVPLSRARRADSLAPSLSSQLVQWPVDRRPTLSARPARPSRTSSPASTPSTSTPRSTARASSTWVDPPPRPRHPPPRRHRTGHSPHPPTLHPRPSWPLWLFRALTSCEMSLFKQLTVPPLFFVPSSSSAPPRRSRPSASLRRRPWAPRRSSSSRRSTRPSGARASRTCPTASASAFTASATTTRTRPPTRSSTPRSRSSRPPTSRCAALLSLSLSRCLTGR